MNFATAIRDVDDAQIGRRCAGIGITIAIIKEHRP